MARSSFLKKSIPFIMRPVVPRVCKIQLSHQRLLASSSQQTLDYIASLLQSSPEIKKQRTVVKTKTDIPITSCRTAVTDPGQHTMADEGLFYTIPMEEYLKTFPNDITEIMADQFTTFGEASMMVRQPAIECINILSRLPQNTPMPSFIFYGQKGCGKTMSMAHAIHYCTKNNWMVLHVPWANHWATVIKTLNPSEFKTDRFDLPDHSKSLLEYFVKKNQHLLDGIQTNFTYKWTDREKTESGVPLMELIDFGMNRIKFSNDVVGALIKELKYLAKENKIKLLIAVDGVNAFWIESVQKYEFRKLHMQQFSLVQQFQKLFKSRTKNTVTICSVDSLAVLTSHLQKPDKEYRPKELLGQEGFEIFDPFIPILVPPYTDKEIRTAYKYYDEQHWIQNPRAKTPQGQKEILFLSGHNPEMLRKILDTC